MFRTILAFMLVVGFAISAAAQTNAGDVAQIRDLVTRFVADVRKGVPPSQYLSPKLSPDERERQMKLVAGRFLTFDLVPDFSRLHVEDRTHVRVPVNEAWTREGTEVMRNTHIDLVRVGDAWYFVNFEFVPFPRALFWILLLGAIFMAALILGFYIHINRRNWTSSVSKSLWIALIFTPVGWCLYPILKPWRRSEGSRVVGG